MEALQADSALNFKNVATARMGPLPAGLFRERQGGQQNQRAHIADGVQDSGASSVALCFAMSF